jgi:hypothetical protein
MKDVLMIYELWMNNGWMMDELLRSDCWIWMNGLWINDGLIVD